MLSAFSITVFNPSISAGISARCNLISDALPLLFTALTYTRRTNLVVTESNSITLVLESELNVPVLMVFQFVPSSLISIRYSVTLPLEPVCRGV